MSSHDRNLLKLADLPKFQVWMDENKLPWRKGKGEFELMQVKLSRGWAAIFTNSKDAVSTPAALREMIARFKKGLPYTGQTARAEAPEESADFLNDLRDDFAMHALQGICAGLHTGEDPHGWTEQMFASEAYGIADAMMAERAKRVAK